MSALGLIFLGLWIICGLIAYSGTIAYFAREYPESRLPMPVGLAMFVGIIGPLGFVVVASQTRGFRHGFKFKATRG